MSALPEGHDQSQAALPWLPLLSLVSAFALSQSFRTVTAMMATGLQHDFGLSSETLGILAATFAFSFGLSHWTVPLSPTEFQWRADLCRRAGQGGGTCA
jgi:sugar phosphate permease